MATKTDYIDVSDLDKFQKILGKINPSDSEAEATRLVRKIIANALRKAQKEAEQTVGASIPNNQRHAEKAVRSRSYSRKSGVLGGILTTLRGKRSGNSAPRSAPPTKSGRERNWSQRTKQMYGYTGMDAQFLLYWLAMGTAERRSGVGRADRKTGEYGTRSTSKAREAYFGGTHRVGRINTDTANYNLTAILQRIISSDVIKQINDVYNNIDK